VIGAKLRAAGRDATAYEALRSQFVAHSTTACHAELIVLLHKGMAAWMAHELPTPRQQTASAVVPITTTTDHVATEVQAAVVQVLASMALCRRQELHR